MWAILSIFLRKNSGGGFSPTAIGGLVMIAVVMMGTIWVNGEYEQWKLRKQNAHNIETVKEQVKEQNDARREISKQKEEFNNAESNEDRIRALNCILGGVCD